MKKFIVFCLMAFVMCVNANAQERVNGEIYTFQNSSEQLTTFTGYVYSGYCIQVDADGYYLLKKITELAR